MFKPSSRIKISLCAALIPFVVSAKVDPLPPSAQVKLDEPEPFCDSGVPQVWREAQVLEGVSIQESRLCNPDNPAEIAAFVKGTNRISMQTLMDTNLAADALFTGDDTDGDGDPDFYKIKLEIAELNGHSPDFQGFVPTFDIAPGIQPGLWVFTPKTRDMSTRSFASTEANPMLRLPSPTIRVEQGDTVWLIIENTHYFPHSIHLHGVDHPFMDHGGGGNDGVGQTSEMDIMPGQSKTYVIKPRVPGTMYYHCHVQPHTHIPMGLQAMMVVEENRPNNWVQVFNVGAGQVRHPSVAVLEDYAQEYDLHFQSIDKELHHLIQTANDPRLIAKSMNQLYDITDASDDYYVLNGRSFPYTLRESLIVVKPDQKVKLRVLNGHTETLALHTHGHKATITHYDGVEHNREARITRDVYGMTPAQRLDLELNTQNDGLHSFGPGVWMFHDHVEKAFTTDGQGEGGSISLIVYDKFVDEKGTPATHGMDITRYFTKGYWLRDFPVWQDLDQNNALGGIKGLEKASPLAAATSSTTGGAQAGPGSSAASSPKDNSAGSPFSSLMIGLILGAVGSFIYGNRTKLRSLLDNALAQIKSGQSS